MTMYYIFIAFSITQLSLSNRDHCRALVLCGGGSKGAYQAGAIYGIVFKSLQLKQLDGNENFVKNNLYGEDQKYSRRFLQKLNTQKLKFPRNISSIINQNSVEWDVISGVSAGSINSAALVMHRKGQELLAAKESCKLWKNITNDDIWDYWDWKIIDGLWKPGLLDSSPLFNFLRKALQPFTNGMIQRGITLAAVELNTGKYKVFTDKNYITSEDKLLKTIMCSTAMPFVFPPQECDSNLYIDGGSTFNCNIEGAIERCKLETGQDSKITLDLIATNVIDSYQKIETGDINGWNIFSMFYHRTNFLNQYKTQLDLVRSQHPEVELRYIVYPNETLFNDLVPMNFNPSNSKIMVEKGFNDGASVVQQFIIKQLGDIQVD